MPPVVQPILFGAVLPAIFAAGALVLLRGAGGAAAIAGALIIALTGAIGWPASPNAAAEWLPYIAIGAAGVGLLDALAKIPPAARLVIRLIAAEAALYLTLRRLLPQWTPLEGAAWMGGLGAGLVVFWTALDVSAPKLKGARLPFLLAALAGGTAGVTLLTGSALIGQLAGSIAAATGTAFVIGWSRPALIQGLAPSGIPPFALLVGLLMVHGNVLSYTPPLPLLLLAAAPILAITGRFWPPLIPIAGALALAGREHLAAASSAYGY